MFFAGEPVPPGSEECGKPPDGAELTAFYDCVMSDWTSQDPNPLLSNGGLLHTDWEELHGGQSGIDWQRIASVADNDIPSLHTYPAQIIAGVPVEYQTPKFAPYVIDLEQAVVHGGVRLRSGGR